MLSSFGMGCVCWLLCDGWFYIFCFVFYFGGLMVELSDKVKEFITKTVREEIVKILPLTIVTREDLRLAIETMNKRFENLQKNLDRRFEDLQKYLDRCFEAVNGRFEDMNRRFEDMNKRFEDMFRLLRLMFIVLSLLIAVFGFLGMYIV